MKRAIASLTVAAIVSTALLLLSAPGARAAQTDSAPTVNKLADVSTLFDSGKATVTEFATILEVLHERYSTPSEATATVLKIRTLEGDYMAYMGPTRFLERRGVTFTPGETIVLQGIMVKRDGEPWLVSRVFSNDAAVLALRDRTGKLGTSLLGGSLACGDDVVVCQR